MLRQGLPCSLSHTSHLRKELTATNERRQSFEKPTFLKCSPSTFSPVCSKENEGFSFQVSSFSFLFWILLSPGQSHLAAPQHCHGHSCVKSEQKVQGTFSIIRSTQTFTPGNLSQLEQEQQSHQDIFFVVAGRFHGFSFIASSN